MHRFWLIIDWLTAIVNNPRILCSIYSTVPEGIAGARGSTCYAQYNTTRSAAVAVSICLTGSHCTAITITPQFCRAFYYYIAAAIGAVGRGAECAIYIWQLFAAERCRGKSGWRESTDSLCRQNGTRVWCFVEMFGLLYLRASDAFHHHH